MFVIDVDHSTDFQVTKQKRYQLTLMYGHKTDKRVCQTLTDAHSHRAHRHTIF